MALTVSSSVPSVSTAWESVVELPTTDVGCSARGRPADQPPRDEARARRQPDRMDGGSGDSRDRGALKLVRGGPRLHCTQRDMRQRDLARETRCSGSATHVPECHLSRTRRPGRGPRPSVRGRSSPSPPVTGSGASASIVSRTSTDPAEVPRPIRSPGDGARRNDERPRAAPLGARSGIHGSALPIFPAKPSLVGCRCVDPEVPCLRTLARKPLHDWTAVGSPRDEPHYAARPHEVRAGPVLEVNLHPGSHRRPLAGESDSHC